VGSPELILPEPRPARAHAAQIVEVALLARLVDREVLEEREVVGAQRNSAVRSGTSDARKSIKNVFLIGGVTLSTSTAK
jgi:hypothetical protein